MMKHILWALPVAALCIYICGCDSSAEAPPPHADRKTIFLVSEYVDGKEIAGRGVASGDSIFDELARYANRSDVGRGSRTRVSYVPALLIESQTIKINFLENGVVVSTRSTPNDVWSPRLRAKTSLDEQIEAVVRDYVRGTFDDQSE